MAVDTFANQIGGHLSRRGAGLLGETAQNLSWHRHDRGVIQRIEPVSQHDTGPIGDGQFARILQRGICPTVQIRRHDDGLQARCESS